MVSIQKTWIKLLNSYDFLKSLYECFKSSVFLGERLSMEGQMSLRID